MKVKVETYCIHAGEGYCPDSIKTRAPKSSDPARGYNDVPREDFDDMGGATLIIEADTVSEARLIWAEFALGCTRIRGADDDHYDYFPSHFDALVALGLGLDDWAQDSWCIEQARRIWDDHAYDNWSRNHVLKNSVEYAAQEFADEIVPRP